MWRKKCIEGKASEAELDKGIEADMQKSFFDTLKALDISVDELKNFAELYKSGLADEELPANLLIVDVTFNSPT